jgi:hypothetical protein
MRRSPQVVALPESSAVQIENLISRQGCTERWMFRVRFCTQVRANQRPIVISGRVITKSSAPEQLWLFRADSGGLTTCR